MDDNTKETDFFKDLESTKARENFDFMVFLMCSSDIPNSYPSHVKLGKKTTLELSHFYVSSFLYTKETISLIETILKNRTVIHNGEIVGAVSWTNNLDREILLELDTRKFFISVGVLEHELVHLLQALSYNNPEKQYTEVLSIFAELVTMDLLSKAFHRESIFTHYLLFRIIKRISFGIYTTDFFGENLEKEAIELKDMKRTCYEYMLGFIYGIRLYELFLLEPENIKLAINEVLLGRKKVEQLLKDYAICLENEQVVASFKNIILMYQTAVVEKFGTNTHRI